MQKKKKSYFWIRYHNSYYFLYETNIFQEFWSPLLTIIEEFEDLTSANFSILSCFSFPSSVLVFDCLTDAVFSFFFVVSVVFMFLFSLSLFVCLLCFWFICCTRGILRGGGGGEGLFNIQWLVIIHFCDFMLIWMHLEIKKNTWKLTPKQPNMSFLPCARCLVLILLFQQNDGAACGQGQGRAAYHSLSDAAAERWGLTGASDHIEP